MKNIIYFLLAVTMADCVWAQDERQEHEWKARITVVDDNGKPVPGAQVSILYDVPPPPGEKLAAGKITGLTDTNGVFSASHRDKTYGLGFRVEKSGYYQTFINHGFGITYDPIKWNPTLTLVLKKIGQPIPMYAKSVVNLKLPALNKPIGYDLMAGDWDAPYGKGISADVVFEKEYYDKSANDYYSKLAVGFPKAGDGIQPFTVTDKKAGSDLRSPHESPLDGYQPRLIREISNQPGKPSKFDYDANRIYLFRVRTVLDENGNVKNALYGKMYGDFMTFKYYLNPTPNSRNIEFDPKQNLIKIGKRGENANLPP